MGFQDLHCRFPGYCPVELGASVWIWPGLVVWLNIVRDACVHQVGTAK